MTTQANVSTFITFAGSDDDTTIIGWVGNNSKTNFLYICVACVDDDYLAGNKVYFVVKYTF
jgi:hypothetical protein